MLSRVSSELHHRDGGNWEPGEVKDIRSGSQTYGHRFLTTSGRAGRAIKIKTFEDYQDRLGENFVILDRNERESRILG